MRNKFQWAALLGLSACIAPAAFAQAPAAVERPPFDPARSPVKVVFAPMHKSQAAGDPLPFTAGDGVIGMRTPAEGMLVSVATVGEDGKLQFQCVELAEARKKARAAKPVPPRSGKGTAYEK